MRTKKIILMVSAFVLVFFTACLTDDPYGRTGDFYEVHEIPSPSVIGRDMFISRASAAKMLAFTRADRTFINSMQREIDFEDVSPDMWHDPFINAVYAMGLMSGGGDVFMPDELLTYMQAGFLLDALSLGEGEASAERINPLCGGSSLRQADFEFERTNEPIPYALWAEIIYAASDIDIISFIPLETAEGFVFTDKGLFGTAGKDLEHFIDKEISALVRDNEILALKHLISESPVIRGAYVMSFYDEKLTVFIGGAVRTFAFNFPGWLGNGDIVDIHLADGIIHGVDIFSDILTGTVKRVNSDFTELGDLPIIPNSEDFRVFSLVGGNVSAANIWDISPGGNHADFILGNGLVRAAVIRESAEPQNIRVLLSAESFGEYLREEVSVSSAESFTVWAGGDPFAYPAGDVFTVSNIENLHLFTPEKPRIYIVPNLGGKIEIFGKEVPYRGFLEVILEPCGRFLIINELPLEVYLYTVISGSEFDMENTFLNRYILEYAKVRAVLARSHAYNQFFENLFYEFGAHVDDGPISQVYNRHPETPISIAAVNQTAGLVLAYEGEVVPGSFFPVSGGTTACASEVWADAAAGAFPGRRFSFLRPGDFSGGGDFSNNGDLRDEHAAAAFFRNTEIAAYDSLNPWFRWNFSMTAWELSAAVNRGLAEAYAENPSLILTLQPDGTFRSRNISNIGRVIDIETAERGRGGNIISLKITGERETVLVHSDRNIRALLNPSPLISITRHTGEPARGLPYLPSSFFALERRFNDAGELTGIDVFGGGLGHGVGLSLEGARRMTEAGEGFGDILRRYYPGAVIMRRWR